MSSLSDLKKECQVLGLTIPEYDARAPYLNALRDFYIKRDFPSGLPYEELTPMLAFNYWELDLKQQSALWEDHNWIVQRKLNGCRLILHFIKGVGVFAQSRAVSEKTYRRTELTDHLLLSGSTPDFAATVDSEVVCGKRIHLASGDTCSSLQATAALLRMEPEASKRLQREQEAPLMAHVFDITNWKGQDLRKNKLCERLVYLEDFKQAIARAELNRYVAFLEICHREKKAFFEKVLAEDGEGVVLKNLNFSYVDSSSRSRWGWIKVKRQLELDAYVSGFEPGRVGSKYEHKVASLLFSVTSEAGHRVIAKVSNLPYHFRKEVSVYDRDNGVVKLNLDVYGRVAHLAGLEMSQRAFRLVHPRIVHWRSDLPQERCLYALSDLQDVRSGVVKVLLRVSPKSEDY